MMANLIFKINFPVSESSGHLICLPSHVHLMGVVDGGVFPNFIFDLVGLR